MNYIINSSGIYDVNSYNLISNNATILSSLNVGGAIIGPSTISSISNLNITSTTIINNLNSLSQNSTLLINNLNTTSTTIFNNLNSLSQNTTLNINNLRTTSTTIFNNLNSLSQNTTLNLNNLNATSTTIFNNLNSLSQNTTLNLNNLNATSTTIFNNLNGLSSQSYFLTNYTNLNSLNVSGTTKLNGIITCFSSLNVSGITILSNKTIINSTTQLDPKILLSGQEYLTPATTSTDGIALLLGANRINTRLLFIADSTKLIQNATNPVVSINPTGRFDCTSTDSTTRLPAVFNGALYTDGVYNTTLISSLYISGFTTLNNISTCGSSLNVSGNTLLNNITTCNSSLTVNGNTLLNNITTINSSLYVSGLTIFNNASTHLSSLYISGTTILNNKVGISNISPNLNLDVGSTNANHNIGRAILTTGNIHDADKLDFLSIGRWDGSNTSDWQFSGIKYGVITAAAAGETYNNHTCMTFHTWGNSLWTTKEVMRLTSRGRLGLNTTTPTELLDVNGNIKVSVNNRIRIEGGSGTNALSIGGYGSFQMDAPGVVGGRFSIDDSGNVTCKGQFNNGSSSYLFAGGLRINGADYGNTFYQDLTTIGGQPANIGFTLRDANTFNFNSFSSGGAYTTLLSMNTNIINLNKDTKINGYLGVGITNPSTNPLCKLDVQGIANIRGVSPYAVTANYMAAGSLCIGSTDVDYGYNTGWTANTAGILMECANITEICVHDAGTRVASLLYYYGSTNQIYIGRDKGWGRSSVFMDGYLQCLFFTVDYVGFDKVGVADTVGTGRNESRQMYQIWNSFTDFHRCFVDDELFNKDDPQQFKDIFMGRIVVSTGVIKTHSSKLKTGEESEWEIKTGKEAIIIEDAHPMVQLSRKKQDKRVLGVLGLNTRKNSHPERLIVNAIGEGGIWVCNSNGNIENGDYITSSDYLGYGEKQDDDLLHNYTVAKATINCDFELDSIYYNCLELDDLNVNGNKLRVAFIAVTYHCG